MLILMCFVTQARGGALFFHSVRGSLKLTRCSFLYSTSKVLMPYAHAHACVRYARTHTCTHPQQGGGAVWFSDITLDSVALTGCSFSYSTTKV